MQTSGIIKAFSGFGIELEYMVVDRTTLAVLPIVDTFFASLSGNYAAEIERGDFGWSNEFVLHLLEIKNVQPSPCLNSLLTGFREEILLINGLLEPFNAQLMPTGMHPWMNPQQEARFWPHHNAVIYNTYHRIFNCYTHGWANLQSMHLNLPFADDQEFERLHAAIRLILPILPALAASSPLLEGRKNTCMDGRLDAYQHHSSKVPSLMGELIPDRTHTPAAYQEEVLLKMYQDIALLDPEGVLQYEWLNTRAAIPRFDRNAIEIRILDTQECPEADLAIASLTSAVIHQIFEERWAPLSEQHTLETSKLRAILFNCIEHAEKAIIQDTAYLQQLGFPEPQCTAKELWRYLYETGKTDDIFLPEYHSAIEHILTAGSLAHRIVQAVGKKIEHSRIHTVYQELCNCLSKGVFFDPSMCH